MIVFFHLFSTYSKRLGMVCDQEEEEAAPAGAAAAEGISVDAEWTQLLWFFLSPTAFGWSITTTGARESK